jgi:hypothetical protein
VPVQGSDKTEELEIGWAASARDEAICGRLHGELSYRSVAYHPNVEQ